MHTSIPQKLYSKTKRLRTVDDVEQYFPEFMAFIDSTEHDIPRPVNKQRRRKVYYLGKKKRKKTYCVKTQLVVNNRGFIIYKTSKKKGRRGMTTIFIKRIIL